jgi:hypothetical protein
MRVRDFLAAVVTLAFVAAGRAEAQPKALKTTAEIMAALSSGRQVRVVLHYKDMALADEKGEAQKSPDAIGGMDLGTYEYFAAGAVGNKDGYIAASHTQLIRHPRYGYVLNYVKLSVYDSGTVKIVAQYLSPTTYEVRMDETFTTAVADGTNKGAAVFFVLDQR